MGEEPTREGLSALREDVSVLRDRLAAMEEAADRLPHRRKCLLLVIEFLRRLLALHDELVDDVERELGGESPAPARQRTAS